MDIEAEICSHKTENEEETRERHSLQEQIPNDLYFSQQGLKPPEVSTTSHQRHQRKSPWMVRFHHLHNRNQTLLTGKV